MCGNCPGHNLKVVTMKTITAKYSGRCYRTGSAIKPGDSILWHGKGRSELIQEESIPSELATVGELDPELYVSDHESALSAGRYLAQSMTRGVSDIWQIGGREFYRNKRGLCEDAPCCGCCNA